MTQSINRRIAGNFRQTGLPISVQGATGGGFDSAEVNDIVINSDYLNNENLIINGGMNVCQRDSSETGVAGTDYFTIDRWRYAVATDAVVTLTKSQDVPASEGFNSSFKVDVTTADTSIGADQIAHIQTSVEAQDLQHLAYGTSSAKTLTCSFWVKSNKTGTYCFSLNKNDADGSLTAYTFVKEYTISSADTWEKKIITIEPDSQIKSAAAEIQDDNGLGFRVMWSLAEGSNRNTATDNTWTSSYGVTATSNQVNFLDNTANEFYLTGCQLEVGSKATPFKHKSFAEELRRCQRYFYLIDATGGEGDENAPLVRESATQGQITCYLPTNMRATPTIEGSNYGRIVGYGTGFGGAATASVSNMTVRTNINEGQKIDINIINGSLAGTYVHCHHDRNAEAGKLGFDAEL